MKPCDALLVSRYTESARDLLLVGKALEDRSIHVEICLVDPSPTLRTLIEQSSFPFRYSYPVSPNRKRSGEASLCTGRKGIIHVFRSKYIPWLRGVAKRFAAYIQVLDIIREFARQRLSLSEAEKLLDTTKPKVVVLDHDSTSSGLHIAHAAARRNIPTVVVQSSIVSSPRSIAERNFGKYLNSYDQRSWIDRLCIRAITRKWPAFIQKVDGQDIINFFGPNPVVVGAFLGVMPHSNWLQFGGPATAYALSGKSARDVLLDYGIEPSRIYVCGQPRMDRAVEIGKSHPSIFAHRESRSGGNGESLRVLLATAPWERYGIMDREAKVGMAKRAVKAILQAGIEVRITVKLHPLEKIDEYIDALGEMPHTAIVTNGDIIDLIGQNDTMITQVSTSSYFALAAGRPVILYDFCESPQISRLMNFGLSSMQARSPKELGAAVRSLILDSSASTITTGQKHVLKQYSRSDGLATAATADLVERFISSGGSANEQRGSFEAP